MGPTDLAKEALGKAVETWRLLIEVRASVTHLTEMVQQLRGEQREQQSSFERRIEARIERLERRLDDVHNKAARAEGLMAGLGAEGVRLLLNEQKRQRESSQADVRSSGISATRDGIGSSSDLVCSANAGDAKSDDLKVVSVGLK